MFWKKENEEEQRQIRELTADNNSLQQQVSELERQLSDAMHEASQQSTESSEVQVVSELMLDGQRLLGNVPGLTRCNSHNFAR